MRNELLSVNVRIAEVPARILCKYRENYERLLPYETDEEPAFTVEITEEDIAFSLSLLESWFGKRKRPYEEHYLEDLSIQNVFSKKMLDHNVLMLHGSALCMDGEAYIFTAPSGTGKSTHTRLWRETFGDRVWMINDDKPMIRIENGKATVYGNPWDGKHHLSRNASAPLKAVIWLKRDAENHIEPLKKSDIFPVLMVQGAWSKRGPQKMQAIQLEIKLLDTVAFYVMGCNMDPEAARIAWQGMNEGIPC